MPAAEFTLEYTVEGNQLTMALEYKLADYVENFPRFGIEFGVEKAHCNFSYVGFGPMESYADKHEACEYGKQQKSVRTADAGRLSVEEIEGQYGKKK